MKRKARSGKTRDEKILDTLKNSQWFLTECEKVKQEFKESNDRFFLKNEASRICKLLPSYWENSVSDYILGNELKLPSLQQAHIEYRQNSQSGTRELLIKVYKHTSQEDVLALWPIVEKFKKNLREIWAPDVADLEILRMWEEVEAWPKRPVRGIANQVQTMLNKKRISKSESNIRKVVSRLRKQLGVTKKPAKVEA